VTLLRRLLACAFVLGLPLATGCVSNIAQRPYRFDVMAPVPATTQLVAQRMAYDVDLRPTITDPMRGVVLAPWRMVGVSSSLRVLPPGEDRAWILERYRVVVHPWGPSSVVLVDIERVLCDSQGFRWDAVNLWGTCKPSTAGIAASDQARIDAKAAQLQNARP